MPFSRMRPKPTALALLPLLVSAAAFAHDLQYAVEPGPAIVVRLFYADHAAFAGQTWEVFRQGETIPYQSGRTDPLGRLSFLPDRPGEWRLRATSGDGHGLEFSLRTDASQSVAGIERPLFDQYAKPITGAALLFGMFGLAALFVRKPKA